MTDHVVEGAERHYARREASPEVEAREEQQTCDAATIADEVGAALFKLERWEPSDGSAPLTDIRAVLAAQAKKLDALIREVA